MVNINLSSDQLGQNKDKGFVMAQQGMVVVAIILLVVIAIAGGLAVWKNNINKKILASEATYEGKLAGLRTDKRNQDVVDFQNRLSLTSELAAKPNVILETLQEVEKNIVSGVYIVEYDTDSIAKTLTLKCAADNYESVARQALSFKSSKYFSAVSVVGAGLSNDGKNIFSIEIALN